MAAKKKNSLVNNINKRKKAGKSRPKSRSHVSGESYAEMEKGWPHSAKAKKKSVARKKAAPKKSAAKKKRAPAKKKAARKSAAKKKRAVEKKSG